MNTLLVVIVLAFVLTVLAVVVLGFVGRPLSRLGRSKTAQVDGGEHA